MQASGGNRHTIFGKCKCCRKTTFLKNMWEPYETDGEWEVYGQMIVDCFGIDWTILEVEKDNICQVCISKLRVAIELKNLIQESQAEVAQVVEDATEIENMIPNEQLQVELLPLISEVKATPLINTEKQTQKEKIDKKIDSNSSLSISKKSENTPSSLKKENQTLLKKKKEVIPSKTLPILKKEKTEFDEVPYIKEEPSNSSQDSLLIEATSVPMRANKKGVQMIHYKNSDNDSDAGNIEFVDAELDSKLYEDIEFLEEEMLEEHLGEDYDDDDDKEYKPEPEEDDPKPKTRSRRSRTRKRPYKPYTEEELEAALEAIRSNKMSKREASIKFNVPNGTLKYKVHEVKGHTTKKQTQSCMRPVIAAVRALLLHTNATPFKVRHNAFYACFFCGSDGIAYDDAEDLRAHTRAQHRDVRRVESAVRPHFQNQVVRIDIHELACRDCELPLGWDELRAHLEDAHGVPGLATAWRRIVPYDLRCSSEIIHCVFADCEYRACFSKLDPHMNAHYQNYICGVCGRGFAADVRLRAHESKHDSGPFPCDICGQLYATYKVRRRHIEKAHMNRLLYGCPICPEKFRTDLLKHRHMKEAHDDMLEFRGRYCKLCDKRYWPHDYERHLRFVHDRYVCNKCGRRFDRGTRLRHHDCDPNKTIKRYKCDICYRLFLTKQSVLEHIMNGHPETVDLPPQNDDTQQT